MAVTRLFQIAWPRFFLAGFVASDNISVVRCGLGGHRRVGFHTNWGTSCFESHSRVSRVRSVFRRHGQNKSGCPGRSYPPLARRSNAWNRGSSSPSPGRRWKHWRYASTSSEAASANSAAGPVRLGDGLLNEQASDLPTMTALPWGHNRSWSNSSDYDRHGQYGNGWVVDSVPSLVLSADGGGVGAVGSSQNVQWFDGTSTFTPRHNSHDTLTLASGEYTLTNADGSRYKFYDFNGALPERKRGIFKSYTSASSRASPSAPASTPAPPGPTSARSTIASTKAHSPATMPSECSAT